MHVSLLDHVTMCVLLESFLCHHHICPDLLWFSASGAQSDIKLETEQELSEPVPSEPEPATDMDTTTTECTPVVNTGSNKPTPEDDTTNVETSSANDVIPDSGTGDDTTVTLEGNTAAESSAPCDGSVENLPIGEEKSAGKLVVVICKCSFVRITWIVPVLFTLYIRILILGRLFSHLQLMLQPLPKGKFSFDVTPPTSFILKKRVSGISACTTF